MSPPISSTICTTVSRDRVTPAAASARASTQTSTTSAPLYAETRTTLVDVPVNNIIDDLTLMHKAHTIQFGANYRLIYNHRRSDALSYSYGYTNAYALADAGIANTGQSLDPAAFGFPAVDGSFADSYNFAMANLAGLLDLVTTQANYQIAGRAHGAACCQREPCWIANSRTTSLSIICRIPGVCVQGV